MSMPFYGLKGGLKALKLSNFIIEFPAGSPLLLTWNHNQLLPSFLNCSGSPCKCSGVLVGPIWCIMMCKSINTSPVTEISKSDSEKCIEQDWTEIGDQRRTISLMSAAI